MSAEKLKHLIRTALLHSRLKNYLIYKYHYNFSPKQLCFLCACIDETKTLPGAILEIGCAQGHTTVFLNKHMTFQKIEKPYVCIDTFSGFTKKDIDVEVKQRGKIREQFIEGFRSNSRKSLEESLRYNGISRARIFQGDVADFDFTSPIGISFCLLDVDLYAPTTHALTNVYEHLSPGGLIVVDDCKDNDRYDGAFRAYSEFMDRQGFTPEIVAEKLGVIRKV